jgi:serine protease Do
MLAPRWCMLLIGILLSPLALALVPEDRETKVRNDKKNVEADDAWVYNDLERGIAEAKQSGKPLLVVFRCIPCEACSKFDDQIVRRDPQVRELMDKFVCVRIVHANGMDLSQFQFDYDQSFHAFLMNADKTIYGRFGTRSHHTDETQDMTMEGFGKALTAALQLHKGYPANKSLFAAKRGPASPVKAPEDFPSLAGKYDSRLHYEANVVRSCIHCHQVREAQRLVYRSKGQPIPEQTLYPYPLPSVVGMEMDSQETAAIKQISEGSAAESGGFKPGDRIMTLAGQPLLSIADVQWVLHNAGAEEELIAEVRRGDKTLSLPLKLTAGWRQNSNLSWRPTTWDLRRMASGGMLLADLTAAERASNKLDAGSLSLRVKHVGEYGEHAVAKKAGVQKGDVIVALDGDTMPLSETGFITRILQTRQPGDGVRITLLRDGQRREVSYAAQ